MADVSLATELVVKQICCGQISGPEDGWVPTLSEAWPNPFPGGKTAPLFLPVGRTFVGIFVGILRLFV